MTLMIFTSGSSNWPFITPLPWSTQMHVDYIGGFHSSRLSTLSGHGRFRPISDVRIQSNANLGRHAFCFVIIGIPSPKDRRPNLAEQAGLVSNGDRQTTTSVEGLEGDHHGDDQRHLSE